MSLALCIPDLVAKGTITEDQGRKAQRLFGELQAELRRTLGPGAADAVASKRTAAALEFEAIERRRRELLRLDRERFIEQWLRGGGEDWGRGRKSGPNDLAAPTPGDAPAGPINPKAGRRLLVMMEAHRQGIRGAAFAHMAETLATHRKTVTGKLRNPAEADEIGSAAYGEKVDNQNAADFAASWHEGAELLRQRANAAGANIAKIERWGLPQSSDSRRVAEMGFNDYYALKLATIDREKMIDRETGQPFTDAALERVARDVFDTEASDGKLDTAPGSARGGSLASALSQHRFWIYKDYAGWKANHEALGRGNVLDAMIGHYEGMSRAVAAMEVLGPNAAHGAAVLADLVSGDKSLFQPGALRARDKAKGEAQAIGRLWDEYTGALRQPENRAMALGFGAYRSVAAAAKLGGAPLTAIGDLGYGMANARYNSLPQAALIKYYAKLFNPANIEDRKLAARLGFIAETWTTMHSSQSRFLAEELAGEISSKVADGVLRASGLNFITDNGQMANGLVWLTHVTNERGKGWAELEPAFRAALHRYRIGEKDWDTIRATPLENDGGADWIKPQNVRDRELGDRLFQMAFSERDFAVPAPGIETRAYIDSQWRRGTFLGEMVRSSPLMFKTFTVATMIRHGGRLMDQPGIWGKTGYFLALMIPVTLMGALAVQLKEIAKGRDPRDMSQPSFWGHATLMGGGAGIVGDLLGITAQERFGGWASYAAGPLVTDAARLAGVVESLGKNAMLDAGLFDPEAVHRDGNVGWDLFRVLRDNTPGGNIWYLNKAIDVGLADRIQSIADPSYQLSWARMARRAGEQGAGLWWAPGELTPGRAPDLTTALGGQHQEEETVQ